MAPWAGVRAAARRSPAHLTSIRIRTARRRRSTSRGPGRPRRGRCRGRRGTSTRLESRSATTTSSRAFDGSAVLCHRSSFERANKETGEVKPPTRTGGGFRPRTENNAGKDGHGFAFHGGLTSSALPLVARFTPFNEGESPTVAAMLREDWRQRISPHLNFDAESFGVMAFDSAYSGIQVRTEVHALGYIPNCHRSPTRGGSAQRRNARRHDKMKYAIEGKPGWFANGHREVSASTAPKRPRRTSAVRRAARLSAGSKATASKAVATSPSQPASGAARRTRTAFAAPAPGESIAITQAAWTAVHGELQRHPDDRIVGWYVTRRLGEPRVSPELTRLHRAYMTLTKRSANGRRQSLRRLHRAGPRRRQPPDAPRCASAPSRELRAPR